MAEGRKIPYIIEMLPDTKKFEQIKNKMKAIDMGEFIQFTPEEAKKLKGLLQSIVNDVGDQASTIGKQIQKGITNGLSGVKLQEAFDIDTKKLKESMEIVEKLTNLIDKHSSSDSWLKDGKGFLGNLTGAEQKLSALELSLGKLEVRFDGIDESLKSTIAKFDELENKIKKFGNVESVVASPFNFGDAGKQVDKEVQAIQSSLEKLYDQKKTIKIGISAEANNAQISKEVSKINEALEKNLHNSEELKVALENTSEKDEHQAIINLTKARIKQGEQYRKLIRIKKEYGEAAKEAMLIEGIDYDNLENEFNELQAVIDKDFKKILGKKTSSGGIGIEIALPTTEDIKKKLNATIDQLNKPNSLHKIKLDIDDVANVIEDKTKRQYGDSDAIEDANTDQLVTKTEKRFDRIATSIKGKQDQIVEQTKEWRQKMLQQFEFKSGDFTFEFNKTLTEELQTLFDDYSLQINIDTESLANQIKTVLEGSSVSLGGGTANVDPSAMASAVMAGVRAALVGEPLTTHTPVNSAQERTSDATEQVATEIEQTAKHLDIAEEYVQDVVEKIKNVAKYAVKDAGKADTVGAKSTREQFKLLGIDLEKVKAAGNNDTEIASILEGALLREGEHGKLIGSTAIDELSNFKGSSSKTIPIFLDSLSEVFYMLQEDTDTADEWTRKKKSKEIFDWARGRAKAADSLREVRSPIRQEKIPSAESIDKAIALMTAIGRNTDDLEVLRTAREKLGSQTDEASVKEFQSVADEFYKGSTKIFYDLKQQAEDMFKGIVYMPGSKKGVIKRQNINSYKQLAKIDDNAVLLDIRVSSSMNNVALGEVKSKYGNRPSLSEEQRLMRGQKADYLVSPEYEKDILNKEVKYGGFKPQGTESQKINIEASIERLKKRVTETADAIPELQKQIAALDEEVEIKRQEAKNARELLEAIRNNPNATDSERRDADIAKMDASFALSEVNSKRGNLSKKIDELKASQDRNKSLIKQLELTGQYNTLLSKSLELEGSIVKMEKDGAPQKELQERKQELEGIRTQLTEVVSKAKEFGGLYQQSAGKEYTEAERKTYALENLAWIEDDLITARAQKNVVSSRIKKKNSEIAEVDRWGLGAGIGARELGKEKGRVASEFMNGEYVRALQDALREQTKASVAAAEQYAREVFDDKVSDAMIKEGMNPWDQKQVSQFLETERGQQYSKDFANQVDVDTKEIWAQYDARIKSIRNQVLAEFKESIQVENGVLSYTSKTKDENGKWVNEIVEVAVRDALKERLIAEKKILEEQQTPIQENITRLEADKKAAIEYGGVSEKELLSGDIIADQIRKEEKLAELQADRATKLQELVNLEQAGVPDSDKSVKQAKSNLENADKEIARYEMLIRNRQKLVDMRYDESKESTYTDEEKELHFTNQIVNYNQKIEDSLARQESLKKKIQEASDEDKTQLEYRLGQEEKNVARWRKSIARFEGKLQNVGTAKSEVAGTKTTETTGGLLGLIKEAIGEANVSSADLTQIVDILQKILDVLSGNGVVGSTRNSEMDAKLARIRELEAKKQLANEQKKTAETVKQVENVKKATVASPNVADSKAHKNVSKTQVYKDVQKSVDAFRTSELSADKEPLNAIKLALDELSKINDQNSQEYVEWQRKLGSALAAYGKKNGIENGKGYYEKVYAKLEKNGVAIDSKLPITNKSGISSALVEKGIVTIKEKEAKAKQSEAKAEEKITEEKKEQEKIRFTRKEKKELNRLKKETEGYDPETGKTSEFSGFATENTLKAILEVLNSIKGDGVPKSGTKSNDADNKDSSKDDELDRLAKKSGVSDVRGAIKQHSTLGARGILDDVNLEGIQKYNAAYNELIEKHKEFDVAGTLYDPNNQKTLGNMAIKVKDLGRQLEKSAADAEELQRLVDNSGTYNGQSLGSKEVVGQIKDTDFEVLAKKRLQELGAEHVRFDKIHNRAIGTKRLDNKTVAELEVKYNDLTEAMYTYQKAEKESLTGVPAFLNGFKKKFNSIMQYLSMTMSIHQVLAELRKGVQYVREIDLALTELKKVTDETEEEYDQFLQTAAKTGARLGTTISAVTEATATFAKLGYSMEQATEMAESAIVYKNVGDNIESTEDAADSIISTMKGFKLEATESMAIVDRFNEVGNRFAITSKGIGEALRLSASALSEGGNSLDESIGLITAANEVVNDPSSVGTALKTLTLRLRGSKTELEEMGEDVSDMATTTSQLQAKLLALTGGQVDIMLDENTFKNSTQILREMAAAWEDMTDIQRAEWCPYVQKCA